jgi:hypothetical protein
LAWLRIIQARLALLFASFACPKPTRRPPPPGFTVDRASLLEALEYIDKVIDELEAPFELLTPEAEVPGYPAIRLPRHEAQRTRMRRLEMLVSLHQDKLRLLEFDSRGGVCVASSPQHSGQHRSTNVAGTSADEVDKQAAGSVRERLAFWQKELQAATREQC